MNCRGAILANVIACSGLALDSIFFEYVLYSYCIFFGAIFLGWLAAGKGLEVRILSIPCYFCLVNIAASLGIIDFLRGKQAVTWRTAR